MGKWPSDGEIFAMIAFFAAVCLLVGAGIALVLS